MDQDTRTPTQKLANYLLTDQGGLERFVRDRRAEGKTWRVITRDLWEATGRQIDVTVECLRGWYPDPPRDDAGAVA